MRETKRRGGLQGLQYAGVGISFAAFVAAGWFVGRWADGRFHTEPWLTLSGTLLGITFATIDLIRTSAAIERQEKEDRE